MWYKIKRVLTWQNWVEYQVYPAKPKERIEYKMNADSSGNLYVPIAWVDDLWNYASYSWDISVDWWTATTYSWTANASSSITLSWYTTGTSHIIMITPTTEDYQWARAYRWYMTSWAPYLTEVIYDGSYVWYWKSATSTGDYFRTAQYRGCTNLTVPANEYLPDTVTTIWGYFMNAQYNWCTALTYASEEILPSSVTSIGTVFRGLQYQNCSSLNEIKWWKDLSTIGSPSMYRYQQFYGCNTNKTVKVLSDVWTSSSSDALENSYVASVYVPSAYLTNFKNTSNYPWVWITDSKFIWY